MISLKHLYPVSTVSCVATFRSDNSKYIQALTIYTYMSTSMYVQASYTFCSCMNVDILFIFNLGSNLCCILYSVSNFFSSSVFPPSTYFQCLWNIYPRNSACRQLLKKTSFWNCMFLIWTACIDGLGNSQHFKSIWLHFTKPNGRSPYLLNETKLFFSVPFFHLVDSFLLYFVLHEE